jgi:hypothetical protein
MIKFIELLFITTLIIWGINFAFKSGQLLGFIGDALRDELPKFVHKPLISCPPCMSSVYGIFASVIFYGVDYHLPIFVLALCGLNHIILAMIYEIE